MKHDYTRFCDGFIIPQKIGISLESTTSNFWKSVDYDPKICGKCIRLAENGIDTVIGRLCPTMSLFYFVYGFILEKKRLPTEKELEIILKDYI